MQSEVNTFTHKRAGIAALISGSAAFVALILWHPSHVETTPIVGPFSASALVHGTALLFAPILTYGFWVVTRHLDDRPGAVLGFAFYAFAAMGIVLAATMSGLVMPFVAAAHQGDAHANEMVSLLGMLVMWLNRGFAHLHVAFISIAYIFFALAWPGTPGGWAVRLFGLAVGLGVLSWQLFGGLMISTQTMPVVVVAQQSWAVAAALAMLIDKRG